MNADDLDPPKLAGHGMPLLEIENLHVKIDGKKILKGVDLAVNAGEVHAIMGPNGSGKSTLAYVLAGKDGYEPMAGEIAVLDCRASFAMDNTRAEVDILPQALLKAQEFFT
jgi:Fe-S cluster assembly ATPase SufC